MLKVLILLRLKLYQMTESHKQESKTSVIMDIQSSANIEGDGGKIYLVVLTNYQVDPTVKNFDSAGLQSPSNGY